MQTPLALYIICGCLGCPPLNEPAKVNKAHTHTLGEEMYVVMCVHTGPQKLSRIGNNIATVITENDFQ